MNKKYLTIGLVLIALISGSVYYVFSSHKNSSHKTHPSGTLGMQFEFLGCVGDWPENLPIEPIIKKELIKGEISYFVRDPEGCGLNVKEPRYNLSGNSLILSYKAYASGPVAACYCEYQSRFTFKTMPSSISKVSFIND